MNTPIKDIPDTNRDHPRHISQTEQSVLVLLVINCQTYYIITKYPTSTYNVINHR
jgi:hypothetical protein